MEHNLEMILLLLTLAGGITALAKKLNVPYPIMLVLVGAVIGLVNFNTLEGIKNFVVEDEVFRFVIISIFLPSLLGEATLKLPFSHLKENKQPILALAILGTLISYMVVGFLAIWLLDLPVEVAFVFAALMSATDPVSVLSIFKSMGVPHRLATIMEGESLINDGVAVVLFKISHLSLSLYIAAGLSGVGSGIIEFLKVSAGGILIGLVLAYFFSQLTRFFDDYPLEILFSMVLFYSAFLISEAVHVSGVIAVVAAGLVFGNYGARIGMSPTTKLSIKSFWEVIALIANSLIFLMVGMEIARIDISHKWGMVALAILFVLIARSISVYLSLSTQRNIPSSWKHVFNWGGLRGSLSIALALSLPTSFSGREDVILLTFGVVLFSLVVQGLTIKSLVNFFGLQRKNEGVVAYEHKLIQIQRYIAGRGALEEMRMAGTISPIIFRELDANYKAKLDDAHKKLEELYESEPKLQNEQREHATRHALYAEYEAIERVLSQHIISDNISDEERIKILDRIEKQSD